MGRITVDQSHQIMAVLATNTNWASIDFVKADLQNRIIRNPVEAGRLFTLWLTNAQKLVAASIDDLLEVDHNRSLGEMISQGRYHWVNPNITDENFPATGSGVKKYRHKLFRFDRRMSSEAVIDAMKVENFVPARHEHGLAFGAKFPEAQRKCPIVCLGSSAPVGGKRYVLCLCGRDARRDLNLSWWGNGWVDDWFFLGVQGVSDTE